MVIFMKQSIPAGEFKAKCLHLMDQVQQSKKSIIITKHGKPVAQLVPLSEVKKSQGLFGYMGGTIKIMGDIISPIDDVWNAENDE